MHLPFCAPSRSQNSAASRVLHRKIENKDGRLPPAFAPLPDPRTEPPPSLGPGTGAVAGRRASDRRTQHSRASRRRGLACSAEGWLHQSGEVCRPLVSYGRDTIDMQVAPPLRLLGRRRSRPPRASVRPGSRENAPTRLSWRTPRPRQLCPGTRPPDKPRKPRKPRKCYSIPCLNRASMSRSPACPLLMRHVQTSPLEFS